MSRYFALALALLVASIAEARKPPATEFVTGDGFVRSAMGITVEFSVDASQLDPGDPVGWFDANVYAFPQHLFMTIESSELVSLDVERRNALLVGTATVVDGRTGFEGEVEFSALFEDFNARKRHPQTDALKLTLFLPGGAETWSGHMLPGDIEVGTRK